MSTHCYHNLYTCTHITTAYRAEDAKISAVRASAAGQKLKRIDVICFRRDFFSAAGDVDAAVLAGLHGATIFQAGVSKPHNVNTVVSDVFMLAPTAIFV